MATRARRQPALESVEALLATLDHPLMPVILALRQIILDADPSIAEGVKWNAPSFRTSEYFATMHLRAQDAVQLILHMGARPRAGAPDRLAIADPDALLEWLGPDRASVKFRDLQAIEIQRTAFTQIIRQWIRCLDSSA